MVSFKRHEMTFSMIKMSKSRSRRFFLNKNKLTDSEHSSKISIHFVFPISLFFGVTFFSNFLLPQCLTQCYYCSCFRSIVKLLFSVPLGNLFTHLPMVNFQCVIKYHIIAKRHTNIIILCCTRLTPLPPSPLLL